MSQQGGSQARDLRSRVLEKIASDPQFRKQLAADPKQAMESSEFGQEIKQLSAQQGGASRAKQEDCTWTCAWTE
jgi:hypothetical protein